MSIRSTFLSFVLLLWAGFHWSSPCSAAIRVLLVGVNEQDDRQIPSLPQAMTDIEELRAALQASGIQDGVNGSVVKHLVSQPYNNDSPPTRHNILQGLDEQSRNTSANDVLLVYFTGHAVKYRDKAALVPSDAVVRGADIQSLLSISELRAALDASSARHKIVIIDSCFSGGLASFNPLAPVAGAFVDANLYAIASSSDSELSVVWPSRSQSLATRWLCHGLRGGADADEDGIVSMDELYAYVERNVSAAFPLVRSEIKDQSTDEELLLRRNQKSQTPQRMIGPPWTNPRLFELQPQTANQAVRSLAEQLADRIAIATAGHDSEKLPRVGVLPAASRIGEVVIRGKYPVMEQLMAPNLTQALIDTGLGHFEMLSPRSVQSALNKGFEISSIEHQQSRDFEQLRLRLRGEVDFFVHTRMYIRGDHLVLKAELLSSSGGTVALTTSLVVQLSPELRSALAEESYHTQPKITDTVPPRRSGILEQSPPTNTDQMPDDHAVNRPSIANRDFPVDVAFQVSDVAGTGTWRNVELDNTGTSFEIERDKKLRIVVENQTDRHLAAVVYVDGINILGRKAQTARDALQNSGFWILAPRYRGVFHGWYQNKRADRDNDKLQPSAFFDEDKFIITDAPNSVASQLSYSDNLGDIRIYLYETQEPAKTGGLNGRGIGIGAGKREVRKLAMHNLAGDFGRPAGTLVFRYTEKPTALQRPATSVAD